MSVVELGVFAGGLAGAVVLVFLISYMLLARWWRSQEGQNIVLLSLVTIAASVIGVISRLGFVAEARTASIAVWLIVSVVYVWRIGLLFRAQGVWRLLDRSPQDDDRSVRD